MDWLILFIYYLKFILTSDVEYYSLLTVRSLRFMGFGPVSAFKFQTLNTNYKKKSGP